MFVLFSYGAVKHGDGRNHFSEKNKTKPKKRRLLFWKASESPLVTTEGSECRGACLGIDNGWMETEKESWVYSKEKVGEGKLFWLTAYLQLGNCVLNTFHLSNITMLYGISLPQATRKPSCPAPVCLESVHISGQWWACHTTPGASWPFRCPVNRSG